MKTLISVLDGVPNYTRFLQVREIDRIVKSIAELPGVESRVIGKTMFGEPITALEIGEGRKTAVMIGVPHSDEPLGSLGAIYFARWLATHPEHEYLGWRWVIIPVLERDGMKLNEGWFNNHGTYSAMVKSYFRAPTEDQYEWTFPIKYLDYQWNKSRPETLAITKLLEKERPELLFGMHHCGFHDAYYYLSEDIPEVYPELRKLSKELRIPLSDKSPDVPFGQAFEPGFYKMYGLRDYIDHYKKTRPDYLTTLERGACSDEWYQREIGGFSFNCEVPMYRSQSFQDPLLSKQSFKEVVNTRFARSRNMVKQAAQFFDTLKPHSKLADPVLYESAKKHLANAKLSLKQEEKDAAAAEDRPATNAEVFEIGIMEDLFDLFFLGQIWRVAESICMAGGPIEVCNAMDMVDIDIKTREKSIREAGKFYKIPIRSAVKLQLGSLVIIADALKNK